MSRVARSDYCINRAVIAVFPPQEGAQLVTTVRQTPECFGLAHARWRLADFRTLLPWLHDYTDAGVSLALKRLGIRLKRGRLRVHSPDPAYVTKLTWIARAVMHALAEPTRFVVLWGDEVSIYRQPTLADRYFPVGEEPTADLSHKANTRFRLGGGLAAGTGAVTYVTGKKIGITKLCHFLSALRERYPGMTITLVWDNWPIHRHPDVLAHASERGIHILWLPTYAPWTNPIEKLWRWLRQEIVHHHRRADQWEEMKAAATGFLEQFATGSTALLRYVGLLPN
jgi:transposase